ncbi:unnamed protein product [Notodromas monacha]|uniref:Uncharacterized protein n=1 Tax=Notodromas monacha TaxID=399045 RepID=A0A7R9BNM4_9CRUS|nr:unnamed protein product [Notodromas monacha]CAG0917304.1 unnamed protein product [Notodromas monacha]
MESEKLPFESGIFLNSGFFHRTEKEVEVSNVARKVLGAWNSYESGFRIILLCFFVFTLSVTIALVVQILYGKSEVALNGAVVSDERICTDVGKTALIRGGSAVDAVISTVFCLTLKRPQSVGFGGGGFMLIHKHGHSEESAVLNFREAAPAALVAADLSKAEFDEGKAGLLVGVPGLIAGLEAAHSRYGVLPWADLISPTSQLFELEHVGLGPINSSRGFKFILDEISANGAGGFYNGTIGKEIVAAAQARGGVINENDVSSYAASWEEPIKLSLDESFHVIAPSFPSAGPAALHALGLLQRKGIRIGSMSEPGAMQLSVHALKLSLARFYRLVNLVLGDADFSGNASDADGAMMEEGTLNADLANIPEDLLKPLIQEPVLPVSPNRYGTHVAAVDNKDIYVSFVSELRATGANRIVLPNAAFELNSALRSFDKTAALSANSKSDLRNSAGPGKRPASLATPVIVLPSKQLCGARLVTGSRHVGSVLQVLLRKMFLGDITTESVEKPRWYLGKSVGASGIIKENQDINNRGLVLLGPYPSVNLIVKVNDSISAHSDSRTRLEISVNISELLWSEHRVMEMEAGQSTAKMWWKTFKRYRVSVFFPAVAMYMIYSDYSKTQRFKRENPEAFKELNNKSSVGGDWLFKR